MHAPGTRLCLGCGCVIDRVAGCLCPECGRPFDPEDTRTFQVEPGPRAAWWIAATAISFCAHVPVVALLHASPMLGSLPFLAVSGVVFVRSLFVLASRAPGDTRLPWGFAAFLSLLHLVGCGGIVAVMGPVWRADLPA